MPFRVSYFFSQQTQRLGGWSENFWNSTTNQDTAFQKAADLVTPLRKLHGKTTVLRHYRVSNVDVFRQIDILNFSSTDNPDVTATTIADYPTTALGLKLVANPNYVVRQWIKGTWDSVIDAGGFYQPTATFVTNVNAFFAALTTGGNGWALRVLDRTVPSKVVRDITQAGSVTVLAHGYADNATVRISRAKGLTQANNRWRITVVDADTFSLQGWVAPAVNTPYQGNGIVRLQTYVYPAIGGGIVERATKRNVGRPFGLLSGRRTAR